MWSGTGTVEVPPSSALCMTTWLPLRRPSSKPFCPSIRQISVPDNTRSLANCYVDMSYIDFRVESPLDFLP